MNGSGTKVAMVGLKGIPAKWGGIEKYVEEVGRRLVGRSHEVTVFGANWYCGSRSRYSHLGMSVRPVPTFHVQATDAVCDALFSSALASVGDFDVLHFHGHSAYWALPLIKLTGKPAVITIHQIESAWDNPKYNWFGKRVIESMFKKGVRTADRITTVATHIQKQIGAQYGLL